MSVSKKYAACLMASALLLSGCGDSENFVFTNTNVNQNGGGQVPQAPVAVNDTVTALGNATLNQSSVNGVLNNDTPNGGVISEFDATTTQAGTVALASDGSFTYTPVFGFTGTDTFTYTLRNDAGESSATVTINVPNEGFFVNNQAAPGGNGSQASPFDTLTDALAAASSGDIIYLFAGDGSAYSGAFDLPAGVSLIGQGVGLVVAQTIEAPGTAPLLTGPITCLGDNTVSGVTVSGSPSTGLSATGVSNVTVSNNTFSDHIGTDVVFSDCGGTNVISDNLFQDRGQMAVDNDVDGTFTVSGNRFEHDGALLIGAAMLIQIEGSSTSSININGNTVVGGNSSDSYLGGISVEANDTSQVTLVASNNTIDDVSDDGIDIDSEESASLTATVSGNVISDSEQSNLDFDGDGSFDLTITGNTLNRSGDGIFLGFFDDDAEVILDISGNNINDPSDDGIDMTPGEDASITGVISMNTFDGVGSDGIQIFATSLAEVILAVRGNTFVNTGDDTLDFEFDDLTFGCFDITDNNFDVGAVIADIGDALVNVERLEAGQGGPLESVNTFTTGSVNTSGNVVSVDPNGVDGCDIP